MLPLKIESLLLVSHLGKGIERLITAEPGPILNWQSRGPFIGPRRVEVDPERTVVLL